MKSMIVETCFVEATEDVALYKKLGPDAIGKAIAEAISNKKTTATPQANTPDYSYKVKIKADVLNVRSGAGANYPVVTTVKKNQVYTIIETKNGWGKLKSGAGFICLDYTTRL